MGATLATLGGGVLGCISGASVGAGAGFAIGDAVERVCTCAEGYGRESGAAACGMAGGLLTTQAGLYIVDQMVSGKDHTISEQKED